MFTASCEPSVNVIDLIFEHLEEDHKLKYPSHIVHFIGFEAPVGTPFTLNGEEFVVPKCGHFITPFDKDCYVNITELYFDRGCSDQNIYYII